MKKPPLVKKNLLFTAVLLSHFLALTTFGGEIYRCVDVRGQINFTDNANNRSYRTCKNVSPAVAVESPSPSVQAKAPTGQSPPIPNYSNKVSSAQPPLQATVIKIYRFVDAGGVIHITDHPNHSGYQLIYQGEGRVQPRAGGSYSALEVLHRRYRDYDDLVKSVAQQANLEPALIHAVIQTESAYNPNAVSPKGAVGLMQLMPATARRFGVSDRTDPASNVYGGATYLSLLLRMFNNDMELALAGYNAGENAVIRYGYQIPPYRETRNYVKRVLSLYNGYRNLASR